MLRLQEEYVSCDAYSFSLQPLLLSTPINRCALRILFCGCNMFLLLHLVAPRRKAMLHSCRLHSIAAHCIWFDSCRLHSIATHCIWFCGCHMWLLCCRCLLLHLVAPRTEEAMTGRSWPCCRSLARSISRHRSTYCSAPSPATFAIR